MPYEHGGRAAKQGARYEDNWTILKLLDLLEEKISSITIEPIGELEAGIDLWVNGLDGKREGQQCKGRHGDAETWTLARLAEINVLENWKTHLEREELCEVSLITELSFLMMCDVCSRARNTTAYPKDFLEHQITKTSKGARKFFDDFCKLMDLNPEVDSDLEKAVKLLSRTYIKQVSEYSIIEQIRERISRLFISNFEVVFSLLLSFIHTRDVWGREISQHEINIYLLNQKCEYRNLGNDHRILPSIQRLNDSFSRMFEPIGAQLIIHENVDEIFSVINQGSSVLLSGVAGSGKSGVVQGLLTR